MSVEKTERSFSASTADDGCGLRNAVIAFAIIEALALIPLVVYLVLR